MYQPGTLKLTWINPNDFSVLESTMFDKNNLSGALKLAESKPNFMLFELTETKGDYYKWKLLPYGEAKRFVFQMKMHHSKLMYIVGLALLGFAGYGIYKTIKR